MIITFFEKIKVKFFWWKLGLKIRNYKKLIETTKYLENHQPKVTFNLNEINCKRI